MRPVLLVDDEEQTLRSFEIALRSAGINNVNICKDGAEVIPLLSKQEHEVILLDLMMPKLGGDELLPRIRDEWPDLPVIVITGVNEVGSAVECMKLGAVDYIVKPVEKSRLVTSVKRSIELCQLQRENTLLTKGIFSDELQHPEAFEDIITENESMRAVFKYVEAIAVSSRPVLITGETGVGKELIARAIHKAGGLRGEFVAVNVAGLDDNVFTDSLFGHRKGAFTGADESRSGLVEKAAEGTLFLDEIGELSAASQLKLLRLLQNRDYYPLGSDLSKQMDARVIVATNKDFQELYKSGQFRKDLFYRLRTHHIHVPPLRERKEDIPNLLDHFLNEAASALGKKRPTPPPELCILLSTYNFPGNVRELQAIVFDAVSHHKSRKLSMDVFKKAIGQINNASLDCGANQARSDQIEFATRLPTLKEAERLVIDEALKRSAGNQAIAAKLLGISRQALNRRLKLKKK